MTLRSVNPYTSYDVLLNLQRNKEQMANLTEQIASGNRLTRLSDDPTASALVLNFQDSIEKNKSYLQSSDSAASFLQTTETTLQSVSDTLAHLLELGARALGTTTASGRVAIAQEVAGIKTNLINLANTQTQGKYIFAGTSTTTLPFTASATGANYNGNNGIITLDVSASTTVDTNITGNSAFFNGAINSGGDIFAQVTNLLNGLNDANIATGTATIQGAFDNLRADLGNINVHITDLGGRQATLMQLTDNLQSYNLSLQTIQESYQDLDYPTAAMEYSTAQTTQQASLSVLGKSNALNLFNYLG